MPSPEPPYKLPYSDRTKERLPISDEVLSRIQTLYDKARYLDAWEVAGSEGKLRDWIGPRAQVLGYRLGQNVGASRTAALLINRARRENPRDTHVAVYFGYYLADRRGPISAWEFAKRVVAMDEPQGRERADLIAQQSRVASIYRDFKTAWRLMDEAQSLRPDSAWLATERSALMQREERNREALALLDEAFAIQPYFRPAVQHRARLLHLLGELDEAIAFLKEAMSHIQSSAVALQLWQFRRERDDEEEMLDLLERIEMLSPGAEPEFTDWILAKRADALYLKGEFAAAAEVAERVTGPYYAAFAGRLRDRASSRRRVRLPFRFIQQGHNTCGPATLAAISSYWGGEVAQQEIVSAICYDGTHDQNERRWCEENGYAVKEFTVTWDAARRLLDAGIPFALATVEVESAHLQAVIGYEEAYECLILQDPGEPSFRRVPAHEFLSEYVLTGPRGMALVPNARAAELDALDLPDAVVFDLRYAFALALSEYRRAEAAEILSEMERRSPGHTLVRLARLSLAEFDGNAPERQKCVSEFLDQYPDNPRVLFWQLNVLRESGRHEDRVDLLKGSLSGPGYHPVFLKELARELSADGRRNFETRQLLLRAHRAQPENSATLVELADLLWRGRKDDGLLDYYRFAAARSDKHEGFARTWFFAARLLRRDGEVLEWMKWRIAAYGDKSGAPAVSLANCLDQVSRTDEALRVLDEAMERRPDDGELFVQAAGFFIRSGMVGRARELLERAHGRCAENLWQRALASLHNRLGEAAEALELWQTIHQSEPLSVDAHRETARLLAVLRGEKEALEHLAAARQRFPHHVGLAEVHLEWLRDEHVKEAIGVATELIEINPSSSWARRERAILLCKDGRIDEGIAEAREALVISPLEPTCHGVSAMLAIAAGKREEADASLRSAIRLDVNYGWAVDEYIGLKHGTAAKREALDFVRGEMIRQVLDGNMLHTYRGAAYPILDPPELLTQLREIWEARRDLWETWSILAAQLLDTGDSDEALALAREASGRFPLLPGAWRDLALILRFRGDSEEALTAIRRAVELNPDWELAWRIEADYLEEMGRREEAIATLRRACRRLPGEGFLNATLAATLWRAGEVDEAWQTAANLAGREPGVDSVWRLLSEWAGLLGRRGELVELARRTTRERPGEARSWLILAQVLPLTDVEEELSALDRAISLNRNFESAYDHKATALCRNGRFDEAESCLRSGPWGDALPLIIEGRLAWIESARGNAAAALKRMSGVVERHRDYYWGWDRCAEWAEIVGDREEWTRASAELMRLAPRDPAPCFSAACAAEASGNRDESIRLLRRALHLDPGHAPAAGRLLSILWERRLPDELESFAATIVEGGATRAASRGGRALAAALRDDRKLAEQHLCALVEEREYIYETANTVDRAFRNQLPRRQRSTYLACLDLAVREKRIGPSFARLWLVDRVSNRRWEVWKHFGDWIDRLGERSLPAINEYLDRAGDAGRGETLPAVLRQHGTFLREHSETWGKVGYAMNASGLHAEVVAWLSDAPRRADAEGWILANLVSCLRHLGREDEAIRVSRATVDRGLRDQTWSWHLSLAAFGEALDGNTVAARAMLESRKEEGLPATYKAISRMAEAICVVLENAEFASGGKCLRKEIDGLRHDLRGMVKPDNRLRATYRRTIRSMADRARCWLPWWFRSWPGEVGWFEAAMIALGIGIFLILMYLSP